MVGHLGDKGTPQPIVDKLEAALRKVMTSPEIKQRMESTGFVVPPPGAAAYTAVRAERAGPLDARHQDGGHQARMSVATAHAPIVIRMHARDNVAIVANDGGLRRRHRAAVGPDAASSTCRRATRWRWSTSPRATRCGATTCAIGYALKAHPGRQLGARAAAADAGGARARRACRSPPCKPPPPPPLEGYTFEGYRNADGSVGTRNILAITTTVQCVAGVVEFAVERIKDELLPRYPNVDDVVGLEHTYGCGVAIDAPDAPIPIRTLRNISLNPNFGGEVMVVSLGCEKLQPERLLPPGTIPLVDERNVADIGAAEAGLDVVCLQDEHARRLHVDDRLDHGHGRARTSSA